MAEKDRLIVELDHIIDELREARCWRKRQGLLDLLEYRLSMLLHPQGSELAHCAREAPMQVNLSLKQLARYNGKDGNPAYVAIDGDVYDVTDNAAWAAATHFGLHAGEDLSNQYHSCHAGQQITSNLKKVGKLV